MPPSVVPPQERKPRVSTRPRQADIARAAGVSQATVSIVLGGRDNGGVRISEATREHILEVARNLAYSVNPVARSLAGGRNQILGVYTFEAVFPTVGRDFYQPFLLGIEQEAEQVGYDLLLFTSASMPGKRRSIYAGGVNRLAMADGSILLGRQDDKAEIARLARERFPFVYIGRRDVEGAEISYVAADYAQATDHVVEHLVKLGHRSLAYLGVTRPREPDADREAGWTAAVARLGLTATEVVVRRPSGERGLASLVKDLRLKRDVTALVLENPESAQRVLDVISQCGLRVPDDLSVAVLGDDPSVAASAEHWTGFRIPREAMGRQAVRLLIEALDEPATPPHRLTVPCPFVAGATVAPPAHAQPASVRTRARTGTVSRRAAGTATPTKRAPTKAAAARRTTRSSRDTTSKEKSE